MAMTIYVLNSNGTVAVPVVNMPFSLNIERALFSIVEVLISLIFLGIWVALVTRDDSEARLMIRVASIAFDLLHCLRLLFL